MESNLKYSKKANEFIESMVTIGKWAKSCETKEQIDNVENFLNKFLENTKKPIYKDENELCHVHWGIVQGIILSVRNLKIK